MVANTLIFLLDQKRHVLQGSNTSIARMLSASLLILLILTHLFPHNTPILAVTATSDFDPRFANNPSWNPRGDPENRLFCPAPLPQRNYGHRATMPDVPIAIEYLPSNFDWSHRNFTSLHDLCAMAGNPRGNMGGFVCLSPSLTHPTPPSLIHNPLTPPFPSPQCKENADDTITPNWRMTRARAILLYDPALDAYCRANCTCASSDDEYYALDLRECVIKHNLPPLPDLDGRTPWPPYPTPNHPPMYRAADPPAARRRYNWFQRVAGESSTRLAACPRGFVRCEGQGAGGREISGQKGMGQPRMAPAKRCYCTYNRPGGARPAPIPRPAVPRAGSSPPRAGALPVH